MTMLTFTAGSAFIMWLGEQITERGIGNGMSLIIFVGIVVGLPHAIRNIYQNTFVTHQWNVIQIAGDSGGDGRGSGIHRAGGAGRTPHPGAVCQARYRATHDGRSIDPPAAEGKCRRRYPDHLRFVAAGLAADGTPVSRRKE